ncbi:hypothetical protein [Microbacterium cremeum]|uniref:hypothetical protein n=1 Tax=Microbacterium cremeum TaxID=2782169 RepID=UPI001E41DED6|nr:hypothetical protein [Microbacterium cremeum]
MSDATPTDTTSLLPPTPDAGSAAGPTLPYEVAALSGEAAPAGGPATARPRTRWAAIIWGAAFAAVAAVTLWVTVSPDRRTALADWTLSLSPAAVVAYVVLVLGAIALVAGVVGIVRRGQRAIDARRAVDRAD